VITRRGKPMAKLVPPDVREPEKKKPGSVVEESWGSLRLDLRQVREILSEEDGLFDA